MAISYKDSGVDVERGYKAVELMKKHVRKWARQPYVQLRLLNMKEQALANFYLTMTVNGILWK